MAGRPGFRVSGVAFPGIFLSTNRQHHKKTTKEWKVHLVKNDEFFDFLKKSDLKALVRLQFEALRLQNSRKNTKTKKNKKTGPF